MEKWREKKKTEEYGLKINIEKMAVMKIPK